MRKKDERLNLTLFPIKIKKDGTPRKTKNGDDMIDWDQVTKDFILSLELNSVPYQVIVVDNFKENKTRKLEIHLKGFPYTIKRGTQSIKEGSFISGLIKETMKECKDIINQTVKSYLPIVAPVVEKGFFGMPTEAFSVRMEEEFAKAETVKDIRKVFKKYAYYFHPDKGHNSIGEQVTYRWLQAERDYCISLRIEMVDMLREYEPDMEY